MRWMEIRRNILVTGGAGFIGSNLCRKLLEDPKNYIICLDNFITGKRNNLSKLRDDVRIRVVEHDITEPFESLIKENVDEIYNLACPASPIEYQFDPIQTIKANTVGVLNVLDFAKAKKAKVLQASTSEIYGNPDVHPQKEDYRGNVNTLGPRACYDEGKRVAETLMMEYKKEYDIPIRIARIFNTYGPFMYKHDGRVVSNFINQALEDKDITIYGKGKQTRSFCYVDDQVDGLIRLMSSDYRLPVNIGNPHEITIKELAKMIIEKIGAKSRITYKELPEDDPIRRNPDIRLAKRILGWKPTISIENGLDKTISYFRKINKVEYN